MKRIQLALVALAFVAISAPRLQAVDFVTEQPIKFQIRMNFGVTNTTFYTNITSLTNTTILTNNTVLTNITYLTNVTGQLQTNLVRTVFILNNNIVRAIAIDLNRTNGTGRSLIGGKLFRVVDSESKERIVIRSAATNQVPVDVTGFFGGTFTNLASATSQVASSVLVTNNAGQIRTNQLVVSGLHSVSLNTTNLTFVLDGFGTATGTNVFRQVGTDNLTRFVETFSGVEFSGKVTVNKSTNRFPILPKNLATGPAIGTVSFGAPVIRTNTAFEVLTNYPASQPSL